MWNPVDMKRGWVGVFLNTRAGICIRIFTYDVRGGVQDRDCPRLFHLVEIPSLQSVPPHPKCSRRTFTPPPLLLFSLAASLLFILLLLSISLFFSFPLTGALPDIMVRTCMALCISLPLVIIPRYKLHNPVAPYPPASSWLDQFVMRAPTHDARIIPRSLYYIYT